MLTFDTHCTVCVCVHPSSLSHITRAHTQTGVHLAARSVSAVGRWEQESGLRVCPEEQIWTDFKERRQKKKKKNKRKREIPTLPSWCCSHMLGGRGQTAFVAAPRLLFACSRACAVDSHLASISALFGGVSVSWSTVGHSGTVGALNGGGGVMGSCRVGLWGGTGWLGRHRTVDLVALGVCLRGRARVDAIRVALSRGLWWPPALPIGFDQILQRDGPSLRGKGRWHHHHQLCP